MSARLYKLTAAALLIVTWMTLWTACSSSQVSPLPAIPPVPPDYVKVPHPEGMDNGDLIAIFTDQSAPSPEKLQACADDFNKLRARTDAKEEIVEGAREFVRMDPVAYHWCFYAKLVQLEEGLKQSAYLDERQKLVLDTFIFLTPVARAFMVEYSDSRYLRWATARYRKLSEYVFYRRMDLSPQATAEMTVSASPFGLVRPNKDEGKGVLEKYGLVKVSPPVTPGPGSNVGAFPPAATDAAVDGSVATGEGFAGPSDGGSGEALQPPPVAAGLTGSEAQAAAPGLVVQKQLQVPPAGTESAVEGSATDVVPTANTAADPSLGSAAPATAKAPAPAAPAVTRAPAAATPTAAKPAAQTPAPSVAEPTAPAPAVNQ